MSANIYADVVITSIQKLLSSTVIWSSFAAKLNMPGTVQESIGQPRLDMFWAEVDERVKYERLNLANRPPSLWLRGSEGAEN